MPFNVKEILDGSAALLNDVALTNFTYVAQLPYFRIAFDDLKMELEDNNIPISNKTSSSLIVTSAMTDIGGATGPALPVDLVDIFEVWERTAGTTSDFMLMNRIQFLPKSSVVTAYRNFYSWQNQIIQLPGSTGSIEIKIDYIGDPLVSIVDENTQVRVMNSSNFLKYRNAALCAEFIGENKERADSLNLNAIRSLDTLLNISVKSSQNMMARRKPFRMRS